MLSLVSVAWAYSSYYRSNREVSNQDNLEDILWLPFTIYFFSSICCLVSRFVSGTLFAAEFKSDGLWLLVGGIIAFVHITFLLLYICLKLKPKLEGTAHNLCGKFVYYVLFAYVNFFLFMNLGGRGSSNMKYEMALRYGIIYFENIVLCVVILINKSDNFLVIPMVCVVFVSSVFHFVFLVIFYKLLHPKTGRYKDRTFNIMSLCVGNPTSEVDRRHSLSNGVQARS